MRWVLMVGAVAVGLLVALGDSRSPGDHYPGGNSGTNAAAYVPQIGVYGNVASNDVAVFIDNTGQKVRGVAMTNTATTAQVAGISNAVWSTFLRVTNNGSGKWYFVLPSE